MGKMVRETRYLWIGNLPDGVTEERLSELFGRHGRVQSVKLHQLDSNKLHAVLAFMDIKSAAKAHNSENIVDGLIVETRYNEPTGTGLPVVVHSHETPLPLGKTRNAGGADSLIWNTSSSSSSSSHSSSTNPALNNCLATPNGPPQVTRDEARHHSVSGTYSRKCHDKTSSSSSSQKPPGELSNGNMGQGEKGCIRPTPASAATPCNCTTSDKMLMDLMSERRLHLGRYSPTHRSGVENGLKRSSAGHPEGLTALEKKGICVRGFPATLSDACIKDGLYHQYRKMGKVLSVVVTGQKDDRCGIITFMKRADVLRCLEGNSNVQSFLGYEVTISEHEGFESKRSETRPDDYHHKATRTLFVGNLEPSVTKEQLQQAFDKYGFLIDVELKAQGQSQGQSLSYAYLQYDSIASVVRAVKDMHNKYIGKNMIKLGYGKTLPTNCLWVDGIVETVSEKILQRLFTRYGQVLSSQMDKDMHRCLVYYDSSKHAQRALTELQGKALAGKRIQIDFASKECQAIFLKNLERTGQASKLTTSDSRQMTTVTTSVGPLHRPTGSQSNRNDFGKALRDNGHDLGPLRATNSLERLSSHSDQRLDRGQQFDRNKGMDAETRIKAVSMVDLDIQRSTCAARDTCSSNRVPASGDCVVRSKCPVDTFVPGSGSLYSDSVKTLTDRNCSILQSSLRNRRMSYESPARDGGLRGKAAIVVESSNFDAGDDRPVEIEHREGHSKTLPDPATCDLRNSSASKDVHKKQTLAEYFVKQLSRDKPDNLDSHHVGTDRRFSTSSNSTNGGSASSKNSPAAAGTPGHHETFQRNSDRPAQSNCDGFITKKNAREQPGVKSANKKTQDTLPPGLPRGSHSSRSVSGKSIAQGEGSVWNTNHYSKETKDVSHVFLASSKNDASAKTLANPQHLTGVGSATESRHLTGEGKYLKNRIPDAGFQTGPAGIDSPRSLRKFSDEELRHCQADEQLMPGTNLSESLTKQFQTARTRTDDNTGDLTTVEPSVVETALQESSSRTRRKSDMVDIDNLQQMKRYYQTKHKRLEDLKAAVAPGDASASEPNLENDNLSTTSVKSSDSSKPSRSAGSLPVPWHEHAESSTDVKQDPRVLSLKTGRVVSESKRNDPASSSPDGVVSKRQRALSLPLPRFAHWVLSSANEIGAKRRMSDEACLLEGKTSCLSGILSPHLSPNPMRSEDSCLGFKSESRSTGQVSVEDCISQDDVDFGSRSQNNDQKLMSLFVEEDGHRDSSLSERLEPTQVSGTNEDTCRSPDRQISEEGGSLFARTMSEKVEEGGDQNITSLKQADVTRTDGDSLPVSTEVEDTTTKTPEQTCVLEDQVESKGIDTECHPSSIPDQNSCSPTCRPFLVTDSIQLVKEVPPIESLHSDEIVQAEIFLQQQGSVDILPNTRQPSDILCAALDAIKSQPVSLRLLPQPDPTLTADVAAERVEESGTKSHSQKSESSTESVTFVKMEADSIAISGQNSTNSKAKTDVEQCSNSAIQRETEEEKRQCPVKQEDTKVGEGLGLKRKADVAFQSQETVVTNAVLTCMTTAGSETKKERCKVDEGESPHSKHRKLDDSHSVAEKKTPDASAHKQHRKELEKTHHLSSKTSSAISNANRPSSHSHSKTASEVRVKTEHHDKPTISDSSRSLGKVTEHTGTSSVMKRHDGVREKDRKCAAGNDGGDVKSGNSKKSSELPHATTKKSDHYRDGSKKHSGVPGGSTDDKKGSKVLTNSSGKNTENQYILNSSDAKVSKITTVSCDKSHEKKVRHDGEQSSCTKCPSELETSDAKPRKGSEKAHDSLKISDKCAKSKDEMKKMTAKVSEVAGDSRQERHTKKSIAGHVSTLGKPGDGEERAESHSHEHVKDTNRKGESCNSSSKKPETGSSVSSSRSKLASCLDRKKHSCSDKNTPESRKTQDHHSKGGLMFENKVRESEHKTKSNCLAIEGKRSLELPSHKKAPEVNGNSSEKTHKMHREPVVQPSDKKERKSLDQRLHKNHTPSSDAKTSIRTKHEKASTSKSSSESRTNEKLSIISSTTKSKKSHSRKNSVSDKIRDSSSTPTDQSSVTVAKHEGTASKERNSVEAMQKSQRHMEKCSSNTPKHRPGKVNQKASTGGSRLEKDSKLPKDSNETSVKKEKSMKRPEEKRELKALLQEQDEELMLAPYLSMYDMVKRRSNKEREKEQAAKMEQLRSKTLNRLQACRSRQRRKSNVSVDDNSLHGADVINSSRSKSNKARRKSSYDEQQSKSRNLIVDSSSLSSSSSSAEEDDGENDDNNCPAKTMSRSRALLSQMQKIPSNDSAKSGKSSLSSSDEEEEYIPASRKRLSSGGTLKKGIQKQQKPRKSTTLPVYRSSDNTDSENDKSDEEFSRRNKPVVTTKGSRPTSQPQTVDRTESLKMTTNRKEKPATLPVYRSSDNTESENDKSDEEFSTLRRNKPVVATKGLRPTSQPQTVDRTESLKMTTNRKEKPATLPVYRSSDNTDSENDKSDEEFSSLRRNKPVVATKGSRPTSQPQTVGRTESLKTTTNRKEKPRRFALFTSSSSSSSSESSDGEAKQAVALSSISKKRDDQLEFSRKPTHEKTSVIMSKEKLRTPSNAVATPLFSKKCDESIRKKEGKNSVQKSSKKFEPKKPASSVGNGDGIDASPVDRNSARRLFKQIRERTTMTKKRRKSSLEYDDNEKLDCVKVMISVTDEMQKHKVTKNFSRTDDIWTEDSDDETRVACSKLTADEKTMQKDANDRNGTRVRDSDGEAVNDPVPGLADGTVETNLSKVGWDLSHEPSACNSGQPPMSTDGARKEPTREDVAKSSSFSRLDNIFEKMEQNDGRADRVLVCLDEKLPVMEKGVDDAEEDKQSEHEEEEEEGEEEEKVGKCEWELKREEKDLSIADEVKSLLSEAGFDSDDGSSSDLGYEVEDEVPCAAQASDAGPAMDKKDAIEDPTVVKLELPKQELAKDETTQKSQNAVTMSEDELTGMEGRDVVITPDETKADRKHDAQSDDDAPGMFDSEEALSELTAAIENLIEKELEPDGDELEPSGKEPVPGSEEEQVPSHEELELHEEKEEEEEEEQVHVDLKYAQEKEQLGLDEDTAEEILVEDVTFMTLDSVTERRDNMVDRVTTADCPMDCPYPLTSFLKMFVWVKPVEPPHEIKFPDEEDKSMSADIKEPVNPTDNKVPVNPTDIKEPVHPSAVEIPTEIHAKTLEQPDVGCEIHPDDGEIKKELLDEESASEITKDKITKDTLEEATKVESSVESKGIEVDDKVSNAPPEEELGSGPAFEEEKPPFEKGSLEVESVGGTPPESTVSPEFNEPDVVPSKNGSRRLAGRNGSNRKTAAGGDKSGRASGVVSGMPATPKGVILRTRLQGNVQIVESFSSRGRKIIPKERDVDFMQPGSKCPGKSGAANAVGGGAGGCGRGRGRKGKLPAGVDVRPGKKASDDGTAVDKTEIAEETSLRPLMQRKLLAQEVGRTWKKDFGNAYRGKRVESLRSNDSQKISAKETATLTIARKYGRSTARGRCLKPDTGSAKSLVIQLDKIAMPSGYTNVGGKGESGRRPTAGKTKKEEKMATNSIKDLYEFEDEDEVGPIPEYTHKRPLKRVKETAPADATKTDLRTDDDEAGSQPPLPKRPKRMVKGRTRGRQARSSKLSQRKTRGKVTRSKPAEVIPVVNESSVLFGSTGPESKANITTKNGRICTSDDQSSQKPTTASEPRHLPLKLEMKEQRHAAAACAAALSNRKDPDVIVTTSAADAEVPSKSAIETDPVDVDEVQSNMEKVINEVARGNFDHGFPMMSSGDAETMTDLSVVQQMVVPLRIIRSASVVAENSNSPQRCQTTTTEMNGPCSEAETEQVEEGSALVSPSSSSLHDDSSCVADVTDDTPGASRHLPHEQVIERIQNPNTRTNPAEEGDNQSTRDNQLTKDNQSTRDPMLPAAEASQRISPLPAAPHESNLRTPTNSNRDVNEILEHMRGGESSEVQASVTSGARNRSQGFLPASVPTSAGEHLRFMLAQQQEHLLQQQQRRQRESLSIPQSGLPVSQCNPVTFLPPEFISGIDPQHWNQMKLHNSIAPSRLDAKSAPSTPSQSQVHPPTAAVAPHFADTYLTPSVSGIRPDGRSSHATQSPVAGVYPQPLYPNLRLMSYLHVGVDLPSYERMLLAMTQQQQQHLLSQGLVLPPSVIAMPPHEALVPKRPEHVPVHCPPRSTAAATPPERAAMTIKPEAVAISRSLPEHTDVLMLLLKKYPVVWQGLLSLKNDFSAVQMHFVAGNKQLVELSLPENSQLRLSQRMRLEQSQLEQVSKRMMNPNEYCMLVALPCGQDHLDIIMQSNNLRAGFISYLQQKQAAGIVNITNPGSSQTAYVVHIFPPCQFTSGHLSDQASDLLLSINDMAYLLIVIATV